MDKNEIINEFIENFIILFNDEIEEKHFDVPEVKDDELRPKLKEFFDKKTLTEAENYLYKLFNTFVKDTYEDIDWSLDRELVKETQPYKDWVRYGDIREIWSLCTRANNASESWVKVNGKAHTEEEAAKLAADKWCELIFGWHLQDNGALNENHGGGFPACALATVLANDAKKDITEEMKEKAHKLFYDYYSKMMHYNRTHDSKDLEWLKTELPSKDGGFDWKYGFVYDMYCDYDPSWALYLILENAGIPEREINCICPWKTGITIREEDNAVMYNTYQHREEL